MSLIRDPASARWPNGLIFYDFDNETVPSGDPLRTTVVGATRDWENRAPVRFFRRTNEPDYVLFRRVQDEPRCNSPVGRVGGPQVIRCSGNASRQRIAHELGHVIGLHHEQQRLDRDAMVAVSGLALRDELQNYKRLDQELMVGPYDFGSLMHYPVDTGPARGMMTKIHPDPIVPGSATVPSAGDVGGVKFMYGIVPDRTPIAALSRNDDHIELWVVDEFGTVRGAWYDSGWQTWYVLAGRGFPQRANLACCARDSDHMEVWGVGNDGVLHGIWWDGTWHPWYSMAPAPVTTAPGTPLLPPGAPLAAHSRNDGHLEIWCVGNDGQVHGIWWNGSAWEAWYTLPGRQFPPGAHLVAVGRNDDHMELWAIGTDNRLHGIWWNGDWESWYTLDGPGAPSLQPGGGVSAVSRNANRMEVWTIAADDRLHGIWWDGDWQPWYTLGGPSFQPGAPLTALSRQNDHMEVWAVSDARQLEGVWWNGGAWQPWYVVEPTPVLRGTPLTALHRKANHMEIFCVVPDGTDIFRLGVQGVFWEGDWNRFLRIT